MHIYTYIHVYTYTCICLMNCVCMYTYLYVYVYMYIYVFTGAADGCIAASAASPYESTTARLQYGSLRRRDAGVRPRASRAAQGGCRAAAARQRQIAAPRQRRVAAARQRRVAATRRRSPEQRPNRLRRAKSCSDRSERGGG